MKKITKLKFYDLIVLTIILFGQAIYSSTIALAELHKGTITLQETMTFSTIQNWNALLNQLILLIISFGYLHIRRFDFNVFLSKIKWNNRVVFQTLAIFAIAAIINDIYYTSANFTVHKLMYPTVFNIFNDFDISLIIYSLLNGFYEEIFFLGCCLIVEEKKKSLAIIYSLIIRFSFHTYQGILSALGLGVILGIVMYLLYKRIKPTNLLPFFLAHSIADIVGLSILYYLF